jgi:transcriptional regulator with GAF, ATPase, and Fis domain
MISKEKFFIEAISLFCSSLDITIAMSRLLKFLKTVMPIDIMSVGYIDTGLNRIKEVAVATVEKSEFSNYTMPLHLSVDEFEANYDKSKPLIFNDMAFDEVTRHNFKVEARKRGFFPDMQASAMVLPLLVDGEWIGNFHLAVSGVGQYSQEHADLLEPLQEPFGLVMSNCLQYQEVLRLQEMLADENKYLQQELREVIGDVIGKDYGLKQVMEMVLQAAPKDNPILLFGETGTGKEVIANVIHHSSPRRNGPYIKVNCGAIPESLIDSELFGHEKGAFTGAVEQKRGRFERANHGTIFLDEIGELPLQAQVRLLRVIQEMEIERVGGSKTIHLDIRIIAATHRDLNAMTKRNDFREDLFYRINVFPILIPPLRQRKMDIPELIDYFIERKANEMKLSEIPRLVQGTMDSLMKYDWPGNVRELENVVERALIRYKEGALILEDFLAPQVRPEQVMESTLKQNLLPLDTLVQNHIRAALSTTKGRISGPRGAAAILGLHPNTLRSKMEKLGISRN